ncbi:hypothetical protein VPMS16_710 [Vibrio sp. 16]|nr:hypothetical protein VPMS16_710 [Vibrio sp. 16]
MWELLTVKKIDWSASETFEVLNCKIMCLFGIKLEKASSG